MYNKTVKKRKNFFFKIVFTLHVMCKNPKSLCAQHHVLPKTGFSFPHCSTRENMALSYSVENSLVFKWIEILRFFLIDAFAFKGQMYLFIQLFIQHLFDVLDSLLGGRRNPGSCGSYISHFL